MGCFCTQGKTANLPINYKSIGSVVSEQRIDVTSRATGFIRHVSVLEGDFVSKGQLLVSLDSSDVEGEIEQAKAAINSAKLAVLDADVDVVRYKDLYKRGSVSENTMRKTQLFIDRAKDLLVKAGAVRLRPILLTALAIILSSATLTDPVFGGFAISLIFGTIALTILTFLVVPVLLFSYLRRA